MRGGGDLLVCVYDVVCVKPSVTHMVTKTKLTEVPLQQPSLSSGMVDCCLFGILSIFHCISVSLSHSHSQSHTLTGPPINTGTVKIKGQVSLTSSQILTILPLLTALIEVGPTITTFFLPKLASKLN